MLTFIYFENDIVQHLFFLYVPIFPTIYVKMLPYLISTKSRYLLKETYYKKPLIVTEIH